MVKVTTPTRSSSFLPNLRIKTVLFSFCILLIGMSIGYYLSNLIPPITSTPSALLQSPTLSPDSEKAVIAFPSPQPGLTRFIYHLPIVSDEEHHKVELIVGKQTLVDCNLHAYSGKLEKITAQGWGYTYYQITKLVGPSTTLMACGNAPQVEKFITISPMEEFIRYNSRLPIVVDVPEDFEVKYRVWKADDKIIDNPK